VSDSGGGAAFPTDNVFGGRGMSLRDYFAAKAMAALSVDMDWSDDTVSATVNMAYRVAYAMLTERSKK
jgi:hypothetical protein